MIFKRRINFYDCDPAGIMFFGRASYLAHSAYEEMIVELGIQDYWMSSNFVVPIIKSEVNFYNPLLPGEEVEIDVNVSELKEHSFELTYLCRTPEGKHAFSAKTVHVFTDMELKKMSIPEEISVKLKKLLLQ
jgi:1,4-dihydroxy-2-naphthoyl-CoA hydrolase